MKFLAFYRTVDLREPGFVDRIPGEGMPHYEEDSHGDLFVEYNVVLPMELPMVMRKSKGISSGSWTITDVGILYRNSRGIPWLRYS